MWWRHKFKVVYLDPWPPDPKLSSAVNKFCSDYFNEFTENEAKWLKQDGYRRKIEAVQIACLHLRERAQAQKNTKLVSFYYGKENEYIEELVRITQDKRG